MLRARLWWHSKSHEGFLDSHSRLAFFAQPQIFYLSLLVRLHGITDTTSRKSAIGEKMFSIFLQKMFARLTSQVFVPLFVEKNPEIPNSDNSNSLLTRTKSNYPWISCHFSFISTRLTRTRILEFPADSNKISLTLIKITKIYPDRLLEFWFL